MQIICDHPQRQDENHSLTNLILTAKQEAEKKIQASYSVFFIQLPPNVISHTTTGNCQNQKLDIAGPRSWPQTQRNLGSKSSAIPFCIHSMASLSLPRIPECQLELPTTIPDRVVQTEGQMNSLTIELSNEY